MDDWVRLTSELTSDDAWRFAVEYKRVHERVQPVFVRVCVKRKGGAFHVWARTEERKS